MDITNVKLKNNAMRTNATTTNARKQKGLGLQDCTLSDILFPVTIVDNPRNTNPEYSKVVVGTINGVEFDLNYCSKVYELVPNSNIFPPVRQILIQKGIKFEETYLHLNNARFYAEYRIMDNPYYVGGNQQDVIFPMMKVQHSYNGLTKYMISFGYYRLVCTNGLVIPVKEMDSFNISIVGKHTESIQESLNKLFNVIDLFVAQGNSYLVNFDHMVDRVVEKWEDRVMEVAGFTKISLVDNKKVNTLDYLGGVITKEAEKYYGGVVNDWLVYNAFNQYINDNSLNVKTPEVRVEMDKKVLSYLLNS